MTPSFTTSSQDGAIKAEGSPRRKGYLLAGSAKRRFLVFFPQIPRNGGFSSPFAGTPSRYLRDSKPVSLGSMGGLQILVTGVSGYVGAALVPRLVRDGHAVRGFARSRTRTAAAGGPLADLVIGDATTGQGLEQALEGVDVAYYLIHSMEGPAAGSAFVDLERRQAENFGAAAAAAGVKRIVYLGGLLPADAPPSRHLASRLVVERALLAAAPESIALRASLVIGARSRSFRFLVRLIERLPVLALPAWRVNRTQPIDGRDVLEFLAAAATLPAEHAGRAWDIGGPDRMSYEEMLERIAAVLLIDRPSLSLFFNLTPVAAVVAAAVAGEDRGLIEPLMESLEHDLLPRDGDAAEVFGVRLHRFEAAVERALRDMEEAE
jgi:uncharacterized protein YbjT (DUF2867 family)